jgi:hypothetical protein
MNAQTQKSLSNLAKGVGLTIDFSDCAPVRISGDEIGESDSILVNADQPDSELIFAILQQIGSVPMRSKRLHIPWYVNRPYENEFAGEVAFRTRRVLRHKYNTEWRASLWALCAYPMIGCPNEFQEFLKRHPEKWKFMPAIILASLKIRLVRFFSKFF